MIGFKLDDLRDIESRNYKEYLNYLAKDLKIGQKVMVTPLAKKYLENNSNTSTGIPIKYQFVRGMAILQGGVYTISNIERDTAGEFAIISLGNHSVGDYNWSSIMLIENDHTKLLNRALVGELTLDEYKLIKKMLDEKRDEFD